MKVFFWIFVILCLVNPELILAKLYGSPNFIETNTYVTEKSTLLEFHVKLLHMVEDCVQELGLRNEPLAVKRSKIVCIAECIGRKSHMIDRYGNLNHDGYRNFVNDMPLNGAQRAVAEDVVKKCISDIEMFPNKIHEATGCNVIPAHAMVCVQKPFRALQ
ncbi:uncharacterized protein LOC129566721 [Sitodiplosis mosellana]|uniref:uncharacterized protein LOC129566721 n=1 Tax=Sitodiplosis mosellana TaxID=263140 RepID=UPI0024451F16|nr:uncharacterized protein LOC129566721 [Sitodiplosis mosellana]